MLDALDQIETEERKDDTDDAGDPDLIVVSRRDMLELVNRLRLQMATAIAAIEATICDSPSWRP